jgi:hypothetical protein
VSAFIVDREHVDALVTLAVKGPAAGGYWHGARWFRTVENMSLADIVGADYSNADTLGQMLWTENVRSIHARYPDTLEGGTYPGPCDFTPEDVMGYTWPMSGRQLTAIEGLKALDGYEYQACEHAEWPDSEAYRFCDALRRALVSCLPGYSEASWSEFA